MVDRPATLIFLGLDLNDAHVGGDNTQFVTSFKPKSIDKRLRQTNRKTMAQFENPHCRRSIIRPVLLYRTIFPQMTNWLPEDEGAQLRFEFETEIKRLEAA